MIARVSPRATSRSTWSTARTRLSSRPYSLRRPSVRSRAVPSFVMASSFLISFLLRVVQFASQASNQRRSACRRSTIPSSKSAASEPSGSSISARWASRSRRSSSRRCASTMPIGSAESGLGSGDELQVELGEVGLRPADLGEPLADALLAQGGEHVDLALAVSGRWRPRRGRSGRPSPSDRGRHRSGRRSAPRRGVRARRSAGLAAGSPERAPSPASPVRPPAASCLRYNGYAMRITVISPPVNGPCARIPNRGSWRWRP